MRRISQRRRHPEAARCSMYKPRGPPQLVLQRQNGSFHVVSRTSPCVYTLHCCVMFWHALNEEITLKSLSGQIMYFLFLICFWSLSMTIRVFFFFHSTLLWSILKIFTHKSGLETASLTILGSINMPLSHASRNRPSLNMQTDRS